jgi:hypothetical protein
MLLSGHTENNKPCAEEVLFVRARLHKHTGTLRLREGKISLGIVTLYCALNSAMQWYVACPEHAKKLFVKSTDNLNDDNILFEILSRSGVITSGFDYSGFSELVDDALYKNMSEFNYSSILTNVESVMNQLGILPFDESGLPVDDPGISESY